MLKDLVTKLNTITTNLQTNYGYGSTILGKQIKRLK